MKDKKADVCVLMSTYNGERFIKEQLDSILNQEGVEIKILVRDDGSKDDTLHILEEYRKKGLLSYYRGENLGSAHSFLQLLRDAPECAYYAFSDQDDVWLKNKLIRGISKLKKYDDVPAFYDSMTTVVDSNLTPTGKKYGSNKVYNFATQIARSNVIGCTMILNRQLKNVVSSKNPDYIIMHDQWIACVCKGIGGKEVKDSDSYILYRQHEDNEVGAKSSFKDNFSSSSIASNDHSRSNEAKEIKRLYYKSLTEENKKIVDSFSMYLINRESKKNCIRLKLNPEKKWMRLLIRMAILRNRL